MKSSETYSSYAFEHLYRAYAPVAWRIIQDFIADDAEAERALTAVFLQLCVDGLGEDDDADFSEYVVKLTCRVILKTIGQQAFRCQLIKLRRVTPTYS